MIRESIVVPDAHPLGARPFGRLDYVRKFRQLSAAVLDDSEAERFLDVAQSLPDLGADDLARLTFAARPGALGSVGPSAGLF